MSSSQHPSNYGRFIRIDADVATAILERQRELQLGFDLVGRHHRVSKAEAIRDLLRAPEFVKTEPPWELRCNWRMETLIRYAVDVWGPESDVDPDADNGSMRADLETFLDTAPPSKKVRP